MSSRPLVLAHRGASTHAPDNSLQAIAIAAGQGADGVEIDVRLSSDGALVLSHDAVVPGVGPVADTPYRNLRDANRQLALLDDILPVAGNLLLNMEIKNDPREPGYDPAYGVVDAVVAWVSHAEVEDRCLITSFNPVIVRLVREAALTVDTGLLVERRRDVGPALAEASATGHEWVFPRRTAFLPRRRRLVARAREHGLRIGAWTVDRPGEIRALSRAGIDAVITNDPARALAAVG